MTDAAPEAVTERWVPWRQAWESALYGPDGFYRSGEPAEHFRTSVHASPLFSRAILQLVRRHELSAVTDYGAGSGELLRHLAEAAPELTLTAVELRPRPVDLPETITWVSELPEQIDGLLVANELLDNIPCDIVEHDGEGWRVVEVDTETGDERIADPAAAAQVGWLNRWWTPGRAGDRVEVGLARDELWATACERITSGASLAIDYGHLREYRPVIGTIRSYRGGQETPVSLDGRHDVTAHVAMDSVAEVAGADIARQRDMLRELGLTANRPDMSLAASDPAGYVHALSAASEAGELIASPGLGDLVWLFAEVGHRAAR